MGENRCTCNVKYFFVLFLNLIIFILFNLIIFYITNRCMVNPFNLLYIKAQTENRMT